MSSDRHDRAFMGLEERLTTRPCGTGMSCGHLCRMFTSLTDRPPLEFVVDCRIEFACFYRRQTRMPVQDIAAATGYPDVDFLSRQFKERTGQSPSVYRRA